MLRYTTFSVLFALATSVQPPDVSDPMYDCTYTENPTKLEVMIEDQLISCGKVEGQDIVFSAYDDFSSTPSTKLLGNVKEEALYTLLLAIPDTIRDVGPVVHQMVGNIKGADFQTGDLSSGDIVFDFYAPSPPTPIGTFHYCYLIFEQEQVEDFEDVKGLEKKKFPVEQISEDYRLTLVTSNYFAAKKTGGWTPVVMVIILIALLICGGPILCYFICSRFCCKKNTAVGKE